MHQLLSQQKEGPEKNLHSSHRQFAFEFFKLLVAAENVTQNVVVSPVSAFSALQLVAEAMDTPDRTEMLAKLGLQWSDEQTIRETTKDFRRATESLSEYSQLITANSVWYAPDCEVNPKYKALCEEYYEADVLPLESRAAADAWVSRRTRGMINQVPIERIEQALILNTVYFNSKWQVPFEPDLTLDRDFKMANGESVRCPFMHNEMNYRYYQDSNFQMVSIPYLAGNLSFHAIKPINGDLKSLLANLNTGTWTSAVENMTGVSVELAMPRFNFRFRKNLDQIMNSLGFGAMYSSPPGLITALKSKKGENLAVDQVVQEAVIELEEQGTKAAAVTAASMMCGSLGPPKPPKRVKITLDSPFVFVISNDRRKMPMFMGITSNPLSDH